MWNDESSNWQDGNGAVWDDDSRRPVKNPATRTPPANLCHPDSWLKGYDTGLEMCNLWRAAHALGLANDLTATAPFDAKDTRSWLRDAWKAGYAAGRRSFLRKSIKPVIDAAVQTKQLDHVLETCYYPDEDHVTGERHEGSIQRKRIGPKTLLRGVVEFLLDPYASKQPLPTTLAMCLDYYAQESEGDGSWCQTRVVSVADARKEKREEEFREMSQVAEQFAATCGHPCNSLQFLAALEREVRRLADQREQWRSGEARAERWAACMYAGVGSQVFFEDNDFEEGRFSGRGERLEQCFAYIQRRFPLLWMRYEERHARRQERERKPKGQG